MSRSLTAARIALRPLPPLISPALLRVIYRWSQAKRDNESFVTKAQTGSPLHGQTNDWHAYPFAALGYSEWRLWAVALAIVSPGDTIVEAGAHVGTETVGYSDLVGPTGRVLACEPSPVNRERLIAALRDVRNANVDVLPLAVSDTDGVATFASAPSTGALTGVGHLLGPEEARSGTVTYHDKTLEAVQVEVRSRTLDSVAADLPRLSLIVADVEGSELALLRGGRQVIARCAPVIVLEASRTHLSRAGAELDELSAELAMLGYRPHRIGRFSAGGQGEGNWLCVPVARPDLLERVRRSLLRCALTPCWRGLNPMGHISHAEVTHGVPT